MHEVSYYFLSVSHHCYRVRGLLLLQVTTIEQQDYSQVYEMTLMMIIYIVSS